GRRRPCGARQGIHGGGRERAQRYRRNPDHWASECQDRACEVHPRRTAGHRSTHRRGRSRRSSDRPRDRCLCQASLQDGPSPNHSARLTCTLRSDSGVDEVDLAQRHRPGIRFFLVARTLLPWINRMTVGCFQVGPEASDIFYAFRVLDFAPQAAPDTKQARGQAASALTALVAILLSVSSVFFSSASVSSSSFTASLLPSLLAHDFSVP